jgi:hypothetical protein
LSAVSAAPARTLRCRVILLGNGVLFAGVLGAVALQAGPEGRFAVMAIPGSAPTRVYAIVAAAGGQIISGGGASTVAIARSDAPDFRSRLYAAGALLVFNPLLTGPCGRRS